MRIDGFDWDDGNWPKCAKHGVDKDEIEFVLQHSPHVLPDRTGSIEVRYNAVGKNRADRYVFVVFCLSRSQRNAVVTADQRPLYACQGDRNL